MKNFGKIVGTWENDDFSSTFTASNHSNKITNSQKTLEYIRKDSLKSFSVGSKRETSDLEDIMLQNTTLWTGCQIDSEVP